MVTWKIAALAMAAVLAVPAAALAAQGSSNAATAPAAEAPPPKKICRTSRATGSLTRRTRICMTAEEWADLQRKTYKGVNEMQGNASGGQCLGGASTQGSC